MISICCRRNFNINLPKVTSDVIMDYVRGNFIYVRCKFKEDYCVIMELCFGKF